MDRYECKSIEKHLIENPCTNKKCKHNELGWVMNCDLSYNTNKWLKDITRGCMQYKGAGDIGL